MAVYEVFSHPELKRYKTNVCSRATFIFIVCTALTFLSPLLVAYNSQGFWQKRDFYQEQPDVRFKHQVLVILDLLDNTLVNSQVVWSTFTNFNKLYSANVRIPVVKSREVDRHRDGKNDALYFTLEMPLVDKISVVGCTLLLFFDYKLYRFSSFTMESMAYIHYESIRSGAQFNVVGDLRLRQREYLGHRGKNNVYNTPIIDSASMLAQTYELNNIISNYDQRNFTTYLDSAYPLWLSGRGNGKPFVINVTMNYPEETLIYSPGFWQLMKWAWVQYVAILIAFIFVFDRIKVTIFQGQLVPTIVERAFRAKAD